MNISITARKFKAHPTLKEHIHGEISSLSKFSEDILNAEVILKLSELKDSIKTAEIILHVPGQILTASEDTEDFKKSVSLSVEKISGSLLNLNQRKEIKAKVFPNYLIKEIEVDD
jgi:putative sigma-54 modulation protein